MTIKRNNPRLQITLAAQAYNVLKKKNKLSGLPKSQIISHLLLNTPFEEIDRGILSGLYFNPQHKKINRIQITLTNPAYTQLEKLVDKYNYSKSIIISLCLLQYAYNEKKEITAHNRELKKAQTEQDNL